MKTLVAAGSLAISLALGGAGPASAQFPGAAAQQDPNYFTLRLCNTSRAKVGVALAYRPNPDNWIVAGWIGLSPGDCRDFGRFLKDTYYVYAEEDTSRRRKAVWRGRDIQLCVEYPGPFQRVYFQGHTCSGRLLKGFAEKHVPADVGQVTLNLQ